MSTSISGYNPSVGASGQAGNVTPKGYRQAQLQNYTPEQMQLFQQMFGQVGPDSYLAKLAGGDQSTFEQMEAPAMQQFQGMQGDLASRFSNAGMGARGGSGFQNSANQQTQDFASQLASNRNNLQMQAIQQMQGMSKDLLNADPYEQMLVQRTQPFWKDLTLAGLSAGAEMGASYLGK